MDNQSFEYTYSARRQQEVEDIRKKYLPKEEDKLERLRKLHHSASRKAQAVSIGMGTVGALILGTGMSLCMTTLGSALGSLAWPAGIGIGIAGLVMVALAYPIYNRTLETERRRIAPEILRLSEELLK